MLPNKLICFLGLILGFIPTHAFAQEVLSNDKVEVIQDPKIAKLIDSHIAWNKKNPSFPGFRVQVNSYTSRFDAIQIRSILMQKFPEMGVYLDYKQPSYRLRMGDFRSRFEAHAFLLEMRKDYPAASIVPDNITPVLPTK